MEEKESIKKHYNVRPNKSIQERKLTRNINIRNANNFIKSCLLKKYIQSTDNILDLGVGKGGDFKKYQILGVKEVYGFDIANRSILDALERARATNLDFKLVLKVKDCFSTEFELNKTFNVISIQFSFHYCFVQEDYLNTTLKNISKHLKKDGVVLITIPSKKEILRRAECDQLSNQFYKIEFKKMDMIGVFGNAYYYTLVDSLDSCVEYLVDVDVLAEKALERGLVLEEQTPFDKFLAENRVLHESLYRKLVPVELNQDENDVVSLHEILVFRKTG
ncbi:mRNA cap guanine-N7 methyltransferase [Glugoides intestinalis]